MNDDEMCPFCGAYWECDCLVDPMTPEQVADLRAEYPPKLAKDDPATWEYTSGTAAVTWGIEDGTTQLP